MGALHLGSESYSTDGTNGRVGIGTSSPGCVLDVNVPNSGTPTMLALSNSGGGYADVAEFDYDATNSPNPLTLSLKHSRPFVISGGSLGIACTDPQVKLDVNDNSIRIRTAKTPTTSSAPGTQGQIAWDNNYLYVCVTTNGWKRIALSSW
jgi:hypothetical protein